MTKPPAAWFMTSLPVQVILLLLLLLVGPLQISLQGAASFILKPAPKPNEISSAQPEVEYRLLPQAQQNKLNSSRERFLILTTGEQMKLYKFSQSEADSLLHDYYLIRPIEFDDEQSRRLPENSFSRWLLSRPLNRSNRRKSVIPAESEDQDYGENSDWIKPWITHVDYFFDSNFCDLPNEHCLVVVWLDKANNYVRYGSTPFPPETQNTNTSAQGYSISRNKNVLYLNEFPPIEILRDIPLISSGSYRPRTHAMVVDKRTHRLHVALSNGSVKQANQILSGVLRPDGAKKLHPHQLDEQSLVDLVKNQQMENFHPNDGHQIKDLTHLNVDEANGNLLFYSENGEVFVANVKPSSLKRRNHSRPEANVFLISPKSFTNQVGEVGVEQQQQQQELQTSNGPPPVSLNATSGLAIDKVNRKLFWLDEMNTLFSSTYSGSNLKQVARLLMKPVIKSAESIQVLGDAIYISDSIKKSLLVYRLPAPIVANAAQLRNSISITQATGNSMEDKLSPQQHQKQQVLIVEMPSVYGFRVFELERDSRTSRLGEAAGERLPMAAVEMANSIMSALKSRDIDDSLEDQANVNMNMIEPDARDAAREHKINLVPTIQEEEETNSDNSSKLAILMRLTTYVELLLVSILMITCFVILNLLIRIYRQRHQQELKVNLMKNCSI